jgi:rhomboid protease GluP
VKWWFILFILVPAISDAVERLVFLRSRLPPPVGPPDARFPTKIGWRHQLKDTSTFVLVALAVIFSPMVSLIPFFALNSALPQRWSRALDWLFLPAFLMGMAGCLLLALRARRVARREGPASVELYRDRLVIPVQGALGQAIGVTMPLTDLRSLAVWQDSEPLSLPAMRTAIEERIRLSPHGEVILRAFAADAEGTRALAARPMRVVNALAGFLVVVFLLQWLAGFSEDPTATLYRLGANSLGAVASGQWFRLATANFLHGGLLHLFSNLIALQTFGGLLEKLLGPARFLVLYLASGLAGAFVSSRVDSLAVGASTAVFGLISGFAVVQYRHGRILPTGFRLQKSSWVMLVGINAALPLLIPNISWAGHLGGAIGGVVVALWVARKPDSLSAGPAGRSVSVVAGLLILSHLLAFARGISYARQPVDFKKAYVEAHCSEMRHAKDPVCQSRP